MDPFDPAINYGPNDAGISALTITLVGIGIIAGMAYDPQEDSDLVAVEASHLFPPSTTMIGGKKGALLRGYMYDFVQLFAPHLSRELISEAFFDSNSLEMENLLSQIDLPLR